MAISAATFNIGIFASFFVSLHAIKDVSGSTSTTQNWNCCKPSCSWPGKADVEAPVRSCDLKGQPILDPMTQGSCQHGTSYMCADQSPWQSSDRQAYGFAAVTIDGGSEASWCCACFDLIFTSGIATGKRMTVQATDTVSGLPSGNHFVIAVRAQFPTICCVLM